uniref:Uncharacterized protein n=1 Tax=Anguilla anguilla TaxID=7936 RepID=A0A0E9QXL8_ANGAN
MGDSLSQLSFGEHQNICCLFHPANPAISSHFSYDSIHLLCYYWELSYCGKK